jgi:RimJ/RimL family protein N-acetyltransferase
MKLRPGIVHDWKILLEWRNDPFTRLNSFTQDVINEQDHIDWYKRSLESEKRKIFILEDNSLVPVGTIRSDEVEDGVYVLSWSISPNHRKKGYGTLILELFLKNKIGKFIAEIKPENVGSIRMVEKNGFKKVDNQTYIKVI